MKYVFGPVPSRRLGQSLGVDPVPSKTCDWNCVYCQLGRTRPVTIERKMFFPPDELLSEIRETLNHHKPGEIDWITFVGSGETSLHAGLGQMLREVKTITELPVAVITNGSLLYQADVRRELSAADAVLPSLDAGNEFLFRKINRPHPESTFGRLVEGLTKFRSEYAGKMWIEVMLIKGINDTQAALEELANLFERIRPDEIHILQPTRPPCEPWVQPSDEAGISLARSILGISAHVMTPTNGGFYVSGYESLEDAIIAIITRHPMREDEIVKTLASFPAVDVDAILEGLRKSGKAQVIRRQNTNFWSISGHHYPPGDED